VTFAEAFVAAFVDLQGNEPRQKPATKAAIMGFDKG
jgi:hypothetical protein